MHFLGALILSAPSALLPRLLNKQCLLRFIAGGALSTILAFEATLLIPYSRIPKPVTCINFASPKVGNIHFRKTISHLEKKGLLQIARGKKTFHEYLAIFY